MALVDIPIGHGLPNQMGPYRKALESVAGQNILPLLNVRIAFHSLGDLEKEAMSAYEKARGNSHSDSHSK